MPVLHQAGGGGEQVVGRDRADDDGVDSGGVHAALRQGALGGCHRHVGGGHIRVRDMALADAGPLQDPLVVGLDHLLEVLIGEEARRRVAPQRADFTFGNVSSL